MRVISPGLCYLPSANVIQWVKPVYIERRTDALGVYFFRVVEIYPIAANKNPQQTQNLFIGFS